MRILLVNDDGVAAESYRLLAALLSEKHQVIPVAPDGQKSAASHSLTLKTKLSAKRVEVVPGLMGWAVGGTPADCVRLAFDALIDAPVDMVISGPNVGYNVAFDCLYSGTVSAAMEGAMHGVRSIAVSSGPYADWDEICAAFAELLDSGGLDRPGWKMLNINFPMLRREEMKGVRWVPQGCFHQWDDHYLPDSSEGDTTVYRVQGLEVPVPDEIKDDSAAVLSGYIAVTPMTYDKTDLSALENIPGR